jgi:hypothetical protein
MIDQDVGRYHSLGISGLRVDIWNFSGSELHSYRGKSPSSSKKTQSPCRECTPRMLQPHLTNHALAEICFLQNTMVVLAILVAPSKATTDCVTCASGFV